MYIPASFHVTDTAKLHEFMRRQSFAVLVSQGNEGLIASHLPLLLDTDAGPLGQLFGHMARANPQWRKVEGEVLALFDGPHAYISPRWYGETETVPTWNYVAVHAYGTFQVVEDREELLTILRRSVATYEGGRAEPWVFDESTAYAERMLKSIVGFRIAIQRLEGKWKLGQNHSEERHRRVVRALRAYPDEDSQTIAALMEGTLGAFP
jgi:transcriptional regulator